MRDGKKLTPIISLAMGVQSREKRPRRHSVTFPIPVSDSDLDSAHACANLAGVVAAANHVGKQQFED